MRATPALTLLLSSMLLAHAVAAPVAAEESTARPRAARRLVVFVFASAPIGEGDYPIGLELATTLLATAGTAAWH